MNDELRDLTELQAQIDGARGQLEGAQAHLAASAADPELAKAVRAALDDIVAVGKRMARLQQTVSDHIAAVPSTMPCARCRLEMLATARRCSRSSTPIARA
jgi:hypothetical protein